MPTITFLVTGEKYEVPEGTSFLDFCQEHDLHEFGCTVGSCGTCCLLLAEGAENVPPKTDGEQDTLDMVTDDPDARLGCQLIVNGDIAVGKARDLGHGGRVTGK